MLFVLGGQKYNQNNSVTLLNFSDLAELSGFFGHDLGFKLVFGFGLGLGWVRAYIFGFGPELIGPFTTLISTNFSFLDRFEFFIFFGLFCCRGWHCLEFVLKF